MSWFNFWQWVSKFEAQPVKENTMEEAGKIVGSLAEKPIEIPKLPETLPTLTVTEKKFVELTQVVIDNFEGGYYHPDMKKRFKPSDQSKFGDSGETLFGLDRKHGSQLKMYAEWKQFWDLVDAEKFHDTNVWNKYNYKPTGIIGQRLKELASKIMYKWFSYLAGKYILISSMDEIANDDRLILHFSYASWNGQSWFERYAKALNLAIQNHEGDKQLIFSEAIKARTESSNKVIRQQGANMMALFKKMKLI